MSAQTISTGSNNVATAYAPAQLTALAANGDTLAIWFDGSNVKYSYAASPYTSWTTTTLLSSIGGGPRWQAGLSHNTSDDSVVVVVGNSAGNMLAYVFTYASGSHSWTPGSANTVLASSGSFNGGAVPMCRDAQGRIWCAYANNSHVIQVRYSTDGGATWNASTTATQVGGGADYVIGLAYIGNYVVLTYVDNTVTYVYQRIDAHGASLGSWSTKADTGSGVDNGANACSLRGAPGSNYGVLVNDEGTSIPSRYYNASTDTWSSTTTLGASASDRDPTLATDGTDLYAIWCSFSASNNYALAYKKFTVSTQTWDASATTLEASGANIQWPQADATSGTLAYVWTVGTANPWTVKQDSASISGGPTINTRNVPASAALSAILSRAVPASAALQTTNQRAIPVSAALQATNVRAVPTSAALQATASRAVPSSAALQATASRTIAASAALSLTNTRAIPTSAALQATLSRDVPASAALEATNARTVTTMAALQATNTRAIPASVILSGGANVRSVPASAALSAIETRQIPASAALSLTATRAIPTSAALSQTLARAIPASAALQATLTRQTVASVVLQATVARNIAAAAVLAGTFTRVIAASAVLLDTTRIVPGAVTLTDAHTASASIGDALVARVALSTS